MKVFDSDSLADRQRLVENWLVDIRRRGAEFYSVNRSAATIYVSLQGKERFRYSIQIDLDSQELRVELSRPEWKWIKRERYLLTSGTLRLLAKRMCPLAEGEAVVRVDLLVRFSLFCDAYRRLIGEHDLEHHTQTPTKSISKMESELRQFLTPEEQQKTDNPFVAASRRF